MALSLHLNPSPGLRDDSSSTDNASPTRIELLSRIEALLWRAMAALGCRSEARLWLCSAIGSLSIPSHHRPSLFLDLILPSPSSSRHKKSSQSDFRLAIRQVLRMVCQKRPGAVLQLLSGDSDLIRSFFSGHPTRILQWFGNFASTNKAEHQLGAQALAHFAFIHRDNCWRELHWKGAHGQAPATLASKPYYFRELDILRTVENFLDNVPAFWSAQELWNTFKDGDVISLDIDFFVNTLYKRLLAGDSTHILDLITSFFTEEPFLDACQRILPFVDDQALLTFVNSLRSVFSGRCEADVNAINILWLEYLLRSGATCSSIDDAIISNACVGYARQFRCIFQEDETEEEVSSLKHLILEANRNDMLEEKSHWELRKHLLTLDRWIAVKWLAIESWIIYFCLVAGCMEGASLEATLVTNGIQFSRGTYPSDENKRRTKSRRALKRIKDKKRKEYKKRKMLLSDSVDLERSSNDSDDVESMKVLMAKENDSESLYLSIDNFTVPWNKADIPEHLAGYAFGEWLKRLASD